MPTRTLTLDGATWEVFPSGRITQSDHDEFALMFVRRVEGAAPEVRVTRYAPWRAQSRADSFAGLSAADLTRLFTLSQPGATSPEAGYTP
jgi:hypothetical protein